ncbi:MAG: cobyrinate a,c-diamide synthase [Cyanobacteria bacterium P01_E01_bin.34]
MTLAIAAPASGSGKTTVTLALLAALRQRNLRVQSFKVGPDYIDPMFHQAATSNPCRNLDPFLTSEDYVSRCFSHHCRDADVAVVEGVMGLFDGKADAGEFASTAHVAKLLSIPLVLVIDAQKVGRTVAAIAYGLMHFDLDITIAGIIFNRVGSDRHAQLLRDAIAPLNIPVLGIVRTTPDIQMPSRHLGLIPAEEQDNFPHLLDRLAHLAESSFDWDKLLPLLRYHPSETTLVTSLWPQAQSLDQWELGQSPPVIGVARDPAFNFYYTDNLDLLEDLGAQLEYFSPLQSGFKRCVDFDGVYLGGGFPEVFAAELSEQFHARTIPPEQLPPIYAECGGLMVLGKFLTDRYNHSHAMSGLLPYSTTMTRKLTLGYRNVQVVTETPAVKAGEHLRGHEFHHSACNPPLPGASVYRWGEYREGWSLDRIHASYLHLHWGEQPQVAARWLQSCLQQRLAESRSHPNVSLK